MADTETAADPIEAARLQLEDAQRAATQAEADRDDLQNRRLGGDHTVTAAMFSDAAAAVELAKVDVDGAGRALYAAQREAELRDLDDLKAEIVKEVGSQGEALDDYRLLIEVSQRIISRCRARQQNIAKWSGQLHRAGISEGTTEHGVGWSTAVMGRGDSVIVDGRRITTLNAGVFIGAAARQAALAVGVHNLPIIDHPGLREDPEKWIAANY